MKRNTFLLLLMIPLFATAQKDSIISGVYPWKEPVMNIQENLSTILFEGHTYDMAYLQVTTNSVTGYSKLSGMVPVAEEQLLIIRSGTATMQLKDSLHIIGAGSVAVILPGDTYTIQSYNRDSCWFYIMKYRSKIPVNKVRGKAAGGSFVIDWNKTDSIATNKGSRRNFFERSTAMCKRLEMHVSTLYADSSNHGPQMHRPAELTIMKEGIGELQVGPYYQELAAGNVAYLSVNRLQALTNVGFKDCTYYVIQFE